MRIKKDIITDEIAQASGLSKKQVNLVLGIINNVYKAHILSNEEVHILNICSVKSQLCKAKMARDPRTGHPVSVPERTRVKARILPIFNK